MRVWLGCIAAMMMACGTALAGGGGDHWVGTWATADYMGRNAAPANANAPAASMGAVASADETLREIVHVSLGGKQARVTLSNRFGTTGLKIGAATVALPDAAGALKAGSVHPLLFAGLPTIEIPAGAVVLSDPVQMDVSPMSDLAISLFLPAQPIASLTVHGNAVQTSYRVAGNMTSQPTLSGASETYNWLFLDHVDVMASSKSAAIVTFGDSITDGAYVSRNSNMRWPDELARRLQADKKTEHFGVLNEGIGGNRVLRDNTGPNALARLGNDVLDQSGVAYVIVLEAINDIGHAYDLKKPYDMVTTADLTQGYQQIIDRAHAHGIKVIGATLTPYVGAGYQSPAGEQVRMAVNAWIRQPGHFDGVIDFDKIVRDPSKPDTFLPAFDHGDHLHPGDAGYKAMGDGIDLGLFK